MTTYARVCGLCGRPFAILIPPGVDESERDKLCAECAALPAPQSAIDRLSLQR
jgi:hypothetical protein